MGRDVGVDSCSCAYQHGRRAIGGLPRRPTPDPGRRADVRPQYRPSKVVQIVLPGQVEDIARLNEIVAAYKRRFKQHSVIMLVRPACVSF